MLSFILLTFFCFSSSTSKVSADFLEDYCWRDFDDVIPRDALIAGKAVDDTPIYIGQVLYDNKLIPGKIHQNSSQIHIEFKVVQHVLNETIKILCTKHPEKFIWVPTTVNEIPKMQNKHIFEGGYEKGVITYIGRTKWKGELKVEKVICWINMHCIPLVAFEDGRPVEFITFEILVFDDSVPSITNDKPTTVKPNTAKVHTTDRPIEMETFASTIKRTNTDTTIVPQPAIDKKVKNHSEEYKKSAYKSETPKTVSAIAILSLAACVAVISGAIIFLVRRC